MPDETPLIAAAVGNTRARLGFFRGTNLVESEAFASADIGAASGFLDRVLAQCPAADAVVGSVNNPLADKLDQILSDRAEVNAIRRAGVSLPVPLQHRLEDASTLGVDRALNALGAYSKTKQACVVVDAGTAVTVDFVDGEGTFHGGVIAPGLRMMLESLCERTSQLPEVAYSVPDAGKGPFGLTTQHAMLLGVTGALRGLVRYVTEQYAVFYDGYPQIVATGGDAGVLDEEGIVEHIVPDLQLIGIEASYRAAVHDQQ